MSLHKNWRGDTIIEVMISIVVLSMTIGGAYAIASRSLKAARQAQERGEATKLAESQIENIKAAAANPGAGVNGQVFTAANFCFNPSVNPALTTNSANCFFSGLYHVKVNSVPAPGYSANDYQFTINITWDSLGTSGTDQLTMYYRVLKEQ